tara:strand:- start:49250 stop:49459 length:210 start_codon:yes stop_codon:yes gene_type:complete
MPRKIKGFKFVERQRDAYEEYRAVLLYQRVYGKDYVKVLCLINQFGMPYTDIYLADAQHKKMEKKLQAL